MKQRKLLLLLLALLPFAPRLHADEGMWMLPLLKQQNYQRMVQMGLKLTPEQIYNPQGNSLMEAVVQFGNGCTGEIVSDQGLIFTNHHCGYGEIQAHSSLEHNLLRDGFFAPTLRDELPNPGLTVTITREIVELTSYVQAYLRQHNNNNPMDYLSRKYLDRIAQQWYKEQRGDLTDGVTLDLAPFYEGNKFILFIRDQYSDVRLVAAPPSCIGKYGADTDNWVWPRHSGDFSVFRVYTAPNGKPAPYSPNNIPLRPKVHLQVSTKGVQPNDFVMIMGYPGTTNHFYTPAEVEERQNIDNHERIAMREVRQQVLWQEMLANEKVNIQYAAKYASSTNAYKNAIGTNWAIDKSGFVAQKKKDTDALLAYAQKHNKPAYAKAVNDIQSFVTKRANLRQQLWRLNEGPIRALEIAQIPLSLNKLNQKAKQPQEYANYISEAFTPLNKDYNQEVDRKVAQAMLEAYLKATPATQRPSVLKEVPETMQGVAAYLDKLYGNTIFADSAMCAQKLPSLTPEAYAQDPAVQLAKSLQEKRKELTQLLANEDRGFAQARHTYLQGLLEMRGEENLWPDANFTLRYTFGRVQGYSPRDQVYYGPQTTHIGVLEKEDPTNPEFVLLPKVKQILDAPHKSPYALPNGLLPVNFCATTHTTGGNSGSPVMNANGELVGLNFDRNWEGVGGDISYLPNYQRSIIVDVRYVLFVLDQYLGAQRLLQEMHLTPNKQ